MPRKIETCQAATRPLLIGAATLPEPPRPWLEEQAKAHPALQLKWLLAHADDGVIWGHLCDGALITSDSVTDASPRLREATLRQARLFSVQGELFLWRDGDNLWNARLLYEVAQGEAVPDERPDAEPHKAPQWIEAFDEPQMLWGTHGERREGFTVLTDGAQGLCHAVPLPVPLNAKGEGTPPRLQVRHYLAQEDFARIAVSRLLNLV